MLSNKTMFRAALGVAALFFGSGTVHAQINLGVDTGLTPNAVCVGSTNGTTVFISSSDDCATSSGGLNAGFLQVGPDTSYALFEADSGAATFTGTLTAYNDTTFNGTTSFTDVVSFTGPNATFATPTFFTFPATFQAATTVNGSLTTNGITNTGLITTGNFSSNTIFGNSATITNVLAANGTFTNSLAVVGTANINMGGNQVHGVAAGTAATDAVNVAQLNAATSGITTDVTALQTVTATHTTQIATLNTTVGNQATQITALQAADAMLDTRIDGLELLAEGLDERIGKVDDRASAGTAAAVALSGAMFLPGKSFNLTGNVGSYRGAHAAALQFGALVGDNVAVNAGISHGFNKGGKTAFRAGFTFGW